MQSAKWKDTGVKDANTMQSFVTSQSLKPHKIRYWLHSKEKEEDPQAKVECSAS